MKTYNNYFDCSFNLKKDNSVFQFHPYYEKCLKSQINNISIYNLGCKIIDNEEKFNKFFNNIDYNSYLNDVNNIYSLFNNNNLEYGGGKNGQTIMLRLKRSAIDCNINIINKLYNSLLPSIEEKSF